jgi:predicted DNA-binding transcriptional regulator AlpA
MTEEIKTITNPNQLLSRTEVHEEFGISRRWLELAALSGEGPPYVRVSNRMVRYQRSVLEAWIADRTFVSTDQYKNRSEQNDEQE